MKNCKAASSQDADIDESSAASVEYEVIKSLSHPAWLSCYLVWVF